MGGVGSDIAVDAADIALVDDEVKELPHLVALSKHMMVTIKLNMTFSMTLNFIAITLAILGILNPVVGALVHNAGSIFVIINSAFLLKWGSKKKIFRNSNSVEIHKTEYPRCYSAYNSSESSASTHICKYCSHRIESPYHSISHLLQKSEAFQSVHHVTFILCYTVLYDFLGLRCRFGRCKADIHRMSCTLVFVLIRVRKHR